MLRGEITRLRAFAGLMLAAIVGCGLLDFDVDLAQQTFSLDFGQQTGTMPAVACDASAGTCTSAATFDAGTTAGIPATVDVNLGCDAASKQCYAVVNARAATTVSVLQDDNFSSKVARHSLSLVELSDVAYTIPTNTLTFDIPEATVYAGPAGSTRETDPGVALLGTTQPIQAGTPTTTAQHMTISDDSPARPVIEHAVENKQDFVFIVVASPRMNAGNPVPAGSIQIIVSPKLKVGL
jgi:hypothetical protein